MSARFESDTHVPAQYRGLARQFRDKITASADPATAKVKAIVVAAATESRRGYAGMRPGRALPETERKWRALTGPDRLDLSITSTSTTLQITDLRLVRSNITHVPQHGTVDEPALTLLREAIDIRLPSPRRCHWYGLPLATVSFHAIGRFFERARMDDAVLLDNLRLLAEGHPTLIEQPGEFSLMVAGGRWLGLIANLKEPDGRLTPCIHVRTFVI